MVELLVLRVSQNRFGTFGVCMVDIRGECQPIAVTYELPWKNNQNKISCIVEGSYRFTIERHEKGGALGIVLRLHDVPGRAGVLGHIGNGEGDTEGCILFGESYDIYKNKPGVLQSLHGVRDVLAFIGSSKEGIIHIRKAGYQL